MNPKYPKRKNLLSDTEDPVRATQGKGVVAPIIAPGAITNLIPTTHPKSGSSGSSMADFFTTYKKPLLIGTGILLASGLVYYNRKAIFG